MLIGRLNISQLIEISVKTNISPRISIDIRGEIFVLTQISINLITYIYSNFHEPYLGTIDNVALDLLPSKCRHL